MGFSSGSTGTPKEIGINNKRAMAGFNANVEFCDFTSDTVFMNWLPLEHIATLMEMHLIAILLGAELILVSKEAVLKDAKRLLVYTDRYRVNTCFAPDFYYKMLNRQKNEIEDLTLDLSCIKFWIDGGEMIDHKSTQKCIDMLITKKIRSEKFHTRLGNDGIRIRSSVFT